MAEGEAVPAAQVRDGPAGDGRGARRTHTRLTRADLAQRGSWGQFLKQLASFSGDLSSLTAPSFILSPTSLCEFSTYMGEVTEAFAACSASVATTPEERILAVTRWWILQLKGSFTRREDQTGSEKKPLNPGPSAAALPRSLCSPRRAVPRKVAGFGQHRRDDARVRAGLASPTDQVRARSNAGLISQRLLYREQVGQGLVAGPLRAEDVVQRQVDQRQASRPRDHAHHSARWQGRELPVHAAQAPHRGPDLRLALCRVRRPSAASTDEAGCPSRATSTARPGGTRTSSTRVAAGRAARCAAITRAR